MRVFILRRFLESHKRVRWFVKNFLPLALVVGVVVCLNDLLEPLLDVIPRFTLFIVVSPMVEVFMSKLLNRLFPEPDSLLDESKIEVAVGEITYNEDIQVEFVITNRNAQSSKNSQLHFAVRGKENQARLKWYWRGINDSGKTVEKFVEQMHLENESPHTAILKIRVDRTVKDIKYPNDTVLDVLLVPMDKKFDFKISVVGLNHKRKDEFFTIEPPSKRLHIRKSRPFS